VNRTEKVDLVDALHSTFAEAAIVVVTTQKGMSVAEVEKLRKAMREANTRYKVTKNRLARLALKGTQFEVLDAIFTGPTAIATSSDPVVTAKAATKFANDNDKFSIVAGAMGGQLLTPEQVEQLSKMPPIEELRAKLLGLLQAPAAKLVGVTSAPATKLVRVLPEPGSKLARVFGARGQQG